MLEKRFLVSILESGTSFGTNLTSENASAQCPSFLVSFRLFTCGHAALRLMLESTVPLTLGKLLDRRSQVWHKSSLSVYRIPNGVAC
jgi:hypothetical protein